MNDLKNNFKGKNDVEECLCGSDILVNQHLYQCELFNEGRKCEIQYIKLFNGSLLEQKEILNILEDNMEKYRIYSQAQDLS